MCARLLPEVFRVRDDISTGSAVQPRDVAPLTRRLGRLMEPNLRAIVHRICEADAQRSRSMNPSPQAKSVRRIVVLEQDAAGGYTPVTVYKEKKKKRGSRPLRGLEKTLRKVNRAATTFGDSYGDRHNRSNAKKKNGWIKDLSKNVSKAGKRAKKKL
jgi:hypothetical protein